MHEKEKTYRESVCAYVFAATHTEAFDFVKRGVADVCGDSFDHRPHIQDLVFVAVSFHLHSLFVSVNLNLYVAEERDMREELRKRTKLVL